GPGDHADVDRDRAVGPDPVSGPAVGGGGDAVTAWQSERRAATLVPVDQREWTPTIWRYLPSVQQPDWPDPAALERALKQISTMPPLVFAGEARQLTAALADVHDGHAFLLQAGDCAESFGDFSADSIRDKLKVILQMAVVLT